MGDPEKRAEIPEIPGVEQKRRRRLEEGGTVSTSTHEVLTTDRGTGKSKGDVLVAKPVDVVLGYVLVEEDGGSFRGAVLLTDHRGIPRDFRYTDPISPSRVEKVLYGGALDVYLKEEVILGSLLGAVELRPALWFCRDRELLRSFRSRVSSPVLVLQESPHAPLDHVGEVLPQGEGSVFLVQASPLAAPLRVELLKEDGARIQDMALTLQQITETMDPLEPFSRMRKALQIVGEGQEDA